MALWDLLQGWSPWCFFGSEDLSRGHFLLGESQGPLRGVVVVTKASAVDFKHF